MKVAALATKVMLGAILAAAVSFAIRSFVCCAAQDCRKVWIVGAFAFTPVTVILGLGLGLVYVYYVASRRRSKTK